MTNATTSPRVVCICCQVNEVPWYQLACEACLPTLEAVGIAPAPTTTNAPADQRLQIGPTDI